MACARGTATMADITIRQAVADDLPACAEVINTWMDETNVVKRAYSRAEIAAMFSPKILDNRTIWVAELGGQVEGYLSLIDGGNIRAFYLSSALRGQGVGSRLMSIAKAAHAEFLELGVFETNHLAKKFYEREGFVEVPQKREEDSPEGVPVLFLRWEGS